MSGNELSIDPGRHVRVAAPLELALPAGVSGESFTLEPGSIPAQNVSGRLCFIAPPMNPGSFVSLSLAASGPAGAPVTVIEDNDTLTFREGEDLITQYHFGEKSAYPIPSKPYFYPLNLSGLCLTRTVTAKGRTERKIDHSHHRSLWVAHGDVNGADIWMDGEGHGFQRHVSFGSLFSGPVCSGFEEKVRWETADGDPLMEETRSFRVWRAVENGRLLDLGVTLTARPGPVRLGDTKEGGICSIRVREPLQGDQSGTLTNAHGGVTERECWGYRSPWVDYSGTLEGRKVGIAILDHPSGFRHPTHWHARDYGLCTANPFAWHDYKSGWSYDGSHQMEKGASITFRYRIYLHEGEGAAALVGAHWLNFAHPPQVR